MKERRANPKEIQKGSIYTPGIRRVEAAAISALKRHDEEFSHLDSSEWQSGYSLLDHSIVLSKIMLAVGERRGRGKREKAIGCISALMHDIGKINPTCRPYRLNRKLTPEEKTQVDKHMSFSGDFMLEYMTFVRVEDIEFLGDVHQIICLHHKPWFIGDEVLREIGFDLKIADIFASLMEERNRPGLSQFQAVEKLKEILESKEDEYYSRSYSLEIQSSFDVIQDLYGFDRSINA